MAKRVDKSPAIQLLDLVWSNNCEAAPHSWARVNGSMRDALWLAIASGMRFHTGDIERLAEYRWGFWIGELQGEREYTQAINQGNTSFCEAYEAYRNRNPFRAYGVHSHSTGGMHRERERLGIGLMFEYGGYTLTVTSFSNGGEYVVACSYKKDSRGTLDRRFKLTREQVQQDHKDMEWKQSIVSLKGCVPADKADEFLKACGSPKRDELLRLPRKKIEQAIRKIGLEVA